MGSTLRIGGKAVGPRATADAQPVPSTGQAAKEGLERIVKLVPAEIIGLYYLGQGLGTELFRGPFWVIGCAIVCVVIRAWGTKSASQGPQWASVAISTISFVLWQAMIAGDGRLLGFLTSIPAPYLTATTLLWSTAAGVVYKGDK